ncbi:MAG: NFACT RNA binding domain-containing protein [Thermaerobacter sp.]|nr:NFACT RNA binding domain-containing protein [Thermaerobacter sp.]
MPYDALLLRALQTIWDRELIGAQLERATAESGTVWFVGRQSGRRFTLLTGLAPGLARLHRTSRAVPKGSTAIPWATRLLPAVIVGVAVPRFERVVMFSLATRNEWDQWIPAQLVVELAGHLTNVIWLDGAGVVQDAVRRVPPGSRGRAVWPGQPYTPPPRVPDPCATRLASDLPPWARLELEEAGPGFWERMCQDWEAGFPAAYWLEAPGGGTDIWVYPRSGWHARPVDSLEEALDTLYQLREQSQALQQLRRDLASRLNRRREQLLTKTALYQEVLAEDGGKWRELGDLWLAYQFQFRGLHPPVEVAVDSLRQPGMSLTLRLEAETTPQAEAAAAYKLFKKIKSRQDAAARLLPLARQEIARLDEVLAQSETAHDLQWFRTRLAAEPAQLTQEGRRAFHRFTSSGGFALWVGRNREENDLLTFKKTRPDDIWLHAKSVSGSHVVLFCGRRQPALDDLLDAANLAVFYSPASQSSQVPVDYTRRKFVRKRPHAQPGQVLYQREKTLYITPDPARLKRLGAVSEKLLDP